MQTLLLSLLILLGGTTPAPVAEPTEPTSTTTIAALIQSVAPRYQVNGAQAVKIATCESGLRQFNPDGSVLRGKQNPQDIGIFQVNEKYHLAESQRLGYDIYTVQGNVEYALRLMEKQGTQPWDWSKGCWTK